VVSLASSDAAAISLPASVTIAAGGHQAFVRITNHYAGAPKDVMLTATYAGNASNASVSVPGAPVCRRRTCQKGWWWNQEDCACERGLPQ
jgi:hypothetical protein